MEYHIPSLLETSVEALEIDPQGTYIDATFGGGGHSWAIFEQLTSGHLIAFDQDIDSKVNLERFKDCAGDRSFTFIQANFKYLEKYLKLYGMTGFNGLIADLGVSFHQFDNGDRGFSTRFEGNLDMRMNQRAGKTAEQIIRDYQEDELIHILSAFGEVKNARTLAKEIILKRQQEEIKSTYDLKKIALKCAPKGREFKYLAKLFQALRIEVNDELIALKSLLDQSRSLLMTDGRLAFISYHSLEDRLVKKFFSSGNFEGELQKDFYGNIIRPLEPINRKPIVPSDVEISSNPRSRSAKLRIAKKNNVG